MPGRHLLEVAEEQFHAGDLHAAIETLEELQDSEPDNRHVSELLAQIHEVLRQIDNTFGRVTHENQQDVGSAGKYFSDRGGFTPDDIDFIQRSVPKHESWEYEEFLYHQAVPHDPPAPAPAHDEPTFNDREEDCPSAANDHVTDEISGREPVRAVPEPDVLDGEGTDFFDDVDEAPSDDDYEWEIDLDGLQEDLPGEVTEEADYAPEWESLALLDDDADEGDPEPDDGNIPDILTQEDKAWQVAAQICEETGWGKEDAAPLIEILVHHRSHYKTRDAIKTMILEDGFTADEIATAFGVRQEWASGGYARVSRREELTEGWPNLSWRLAARLVRFIRSDSPEEIMQFVEDCFQDWSQRPPLMLQFKEFKYYLSYVIDHMESVERRWNHRMPLFLDYGLFEEESGCMSGSILWRTLEDMGLLQHQKEQNERLVPYG